jgi:hypothetical protein
VNQNWPTKEKDMYIAQMIMEDYARQQNTEVLGLFELVVKPQEKKMDYRLANWVVEISERFRKLYGELQGEFVTRQIISGCITKGETVH